MARLFGTDGIRGVANVDLKPTLAYALGRATAHRLVGPGGALVVGQDTRRSGDMFVAAIAAGATSLGVDVHDRRASSRRRPSRSWPEAGRSRPGSWSRPRTTRPTTTASRCSTATASSSTTSIEDELEQLIWRAEELGGVDERGARADHRRPRRPRGGLPPATGSGWRRASMPTDCASRARRGQRLGLGARARRSCGRPARRSRSSTPSRTAININVRSGATDPASLAEAVVDRGADVGFALDGDADRLIAVDAAGQVVDGDQVLGILALDRLAPRRAAGRRRRLGPLERRAAGRRRGGRRPGGAHAGRRQVHPRGDAGVGRRARRREERPRHRSSSTPRRATASSPRSRSCG